MKNIERICNMSAEEMARKIEELINAECERCPIYRDCGYNGFQRCKDGWEYWLNRDD